MTRLFLLVLSMLVAVMPATAAGTERQGAFDYVAFLEEGAALHKVSIETFAKAFDDQNRSEHFVTKVRSDPNTFSNVYFDWDSTPPGFVVQYLTSERPILETDLDVTLVPVRYSYADLAVVRDELSRYATTQVEETGFVSVGIDVKHNRVRLGVSSADARMARYADQYGERVEIVVDKPPTPGACNSRTDCPHLRGGIRIRPSSEPACSTGFNGRMSNGNHVHVTAGHCNWGSEANWYLDNSQNVDPLVGWTTKNALYNTTAIDVLRLRVSDQSAVRPNHWNLVYNTNSNKNNAIQNTISNSSFFHGMIVLKSGRVTDTTQGSLIGGDRILTYYVRNGSKWYFHAWRASYAWAIGDSGGTVWRLIGTSSYLVGIHNGGNEDRAVFSSQEDARSALGLSYWCLTSSC
jgi:hypothetical protein